MKGETTVTILTSVCLALFVCDLAIRWHVAHTVEQHSRQLAALSADFQRLRLLPEPSEKQPLEFQLHTLRCSL